MANSLADQVAEAGNFTPVPSSMLAAEDAYVPAQSMDSDLDNMTKAVKKNATELFPQIASAEKEKAAAAKTQALAEAKQIGTYRDQLAGALKDNQPTPVNFGKAPTAPENNPIKQFGSLASLLGIAASAFTKKPIINALNASASAMNAQRAGDKDAYKIAYQQWKDNTDQALEKHKIELENLHEILDLSKEDNAAALAQLKAYGVAQSSNAASVLAQLGDWAEIGKWVHSMEAAGKSLTSIKGTIFNKYIEEWTAAHPGKTPSSAVYAAAANMSSGKGDNTLSDEDYKNLKGLPEVQAAAKAVHDGMLISQAMPGLSAKNPTRQAAQRLYADLHPGESIADAHINYLMRVKEAQGVGALAGKLKFATNLLDQSLPSMMSAAKKLDLSSSTDINTLYNTARSHFSSGDFSNFRTQLRAVASDYAQFIGRGTGTVHSDEEALRILNENMGEEGLQGFVDAVETEKGNVQKAIGVSEKQTGGAESTPAATHKWNPDTGQLDEIK